MDFEIKNAFPYKILISGNYRTRGQTFMYFLTSKVLKINKVDFEVKHVILRKILTSVTR